MCVCAFVRQRGKTYHIDFLIQKQGNYDLFELYVQFEINRRTRKRYKTKWQVLNLYKNLWGFSVGEKFQVSVREK